MSKKKLICGLGVVVMLIMIAFVDLSFSKEEMSVCENNLEALAEQEIDIVKLCPQAGGWCCVSVELQAWGISIAMD